ncbi:unnamed protein product [Darwinula stevensoni]|uniref:Uncharacterized protein n=1 Tax=Darwinula stevensoni TaxID=69355 RepID=A0A7R9A9H9_9CRUS|nr:unnamed protein product [Darwinula stevensoni]CAG0897409.1 unnamed protein product [Darwinula stevensoni]
MRVPPSEGLLFTIQNLVCGSVKSTSSTSACRSCIRGAGYVNLLFFAPSTMSSFLSYLKTNCFTSTYFDSTANTTGNKIIACSTTNLATLGTTRSALRTNYNNFVSCLRTATG